MIENFRGYSQKDSPEKKGHNNNIITFYKILALLLGKRSSLSRVKEKKSKRYYALNTIFGTTRHIGRNNF